jgi:peptide deformylase
MDTLPILTLGDEILLKKALPVGAIDEKLAAFLESMFDAMRMGKGIGLAAPQVARQERFFVTSVDKDKPRAFINPEIIRTAEEEVEYEEGCLSVPGIWADVKRPAAVTIQAWNERGRPFTLDAEGLLARVILHEFDHLEGILFIDRLSPMKRKRVLSIWEKKRRM